jgi:hypothetical protein
MDAPHPLQMVMQLLLSPKTPPMLQLQQAPSARGHSLISDGALEPEDLGSDNKVGSVGRLKAWDFSPLYTLKRPCSLGWTNTTISIVI